MPQQALAGRTLREARWQRLDADEALRQVYMQVNPYWRCNSIVLDLDGQGWQESIADLALRLGIKLPVPNIVTTRLRSGHQQAYFLLRDGVGMAPHQRRAPREFLDSVRHRLMHHYAADTACVGRLMRGLRHRGQRTSWIHDELYTLRDLSATLPTVPQVGSGKFDADSRNWTIFLQLDTWAARHADLLQRDSAEFRRRIEAEGDRLAKEHGKHTEGRSPYTQRELAATKKSVQKRTAAGHNEEYARRGASYIERPAPPAGHEVTPAGLYIPRVEGAALRSRQRSHWREEPLPEAERAANIREAQRLGAETRVLRTDRALREAAVRLVQRGVPVTAERVAAETGAEGRRAISLRTIKSAGYSAAWRAAAAEAQEALAAPSSAPQGPLNALQGEGAREVLPAALEVSGEDIAAAAGNKPAADEKTVQDGLEGGGCNSGMGCICAQAPSEPGACPSLSLLPSLPPPLAQVAYVRGPPRPFHLAGD